MLNKILNKFNVFKKKFFLDKNVKNYVKFNKELFSENKKVKNYNGIILLDFWDWNPYIFFWSILSNYLSKKHNLRIVYFYFPFYKGKSEKYIFFKRRLKKIYESFNCKLGLTTSGKKLKKKHLIKYNKIFDSFKNKDQLRKYKFQNILIGDLIFDTVIRTYQIPSIGIKDQRLREKFLEAHLIFLHVQKFLKNNKVKFLITSDSYYNSFGIVTRICYSNNIKSYFLSFLGRGMYDFKLKTYDPIIKSFKNPYYKYRKIFKKVSVKTGEKNRALKIGKKILLSRVSGNLEAGTPYLDKSPFNSKIKINKNNLFNPKSYQNLLLLHNYFDAPHKYRNFIYSDYLDWANDSIRILDQARINTYIKFHPMVIDKKSDDEAKKGIYKMITNKKHFKIINPKISYQTLIKNGLCSVVTAHGTAACELSYFNIKVLNCGDNPHIDYGFSIHTKNKEEYRNKLLNIHNLSIKIKKDEIYQYYFMNYYYFEQKDYLNNLNENYITKKFINKSNDYKINFHNSSDYYNYIFEIQKKFNVKKKIENYIKEYISKNH